MDVSVIVCTRNRAVQLSRCLDAIAGISFAGAWELIVVDNGSTDDTHAVIARFAGAASFPVKAVLAPRAGLARARNAGLAAADGALICFTDDDCYAQADLLDEAVRAFADPAVGYVSGRVRLFDPDDYPITILESLVPLEFPPRTYLPTGFVQGANMAFRKGALDAVGGFDPVFGAGALFPAEDIDAAARASLKGWKGRYVPEMAVYHHHGRKAADVPALMKGYDLGRGAYNMKLAFEGGRKRWLVRAMLGTLRRAPTRFRSAIDEWKGMAAYARHRLLDRAAMTED